MAAKHIDIETFERKPVIRAVFAQSMPAIIAQLIALLYNWADTFFLARLNQPELVAAAMIALPLYLLLTAIGNLPGVGGGSMLSHYLGKHNPEGASSVASLTIWIGMILALMCAVIYPLVDEPVLRLIGADEQTLAPAREYTFWVIAIGSVPIIMNLVLANLVRAEGLARQASIAISAGGILNCVLDPLLMLPELGNMGITGAAVATALSNMLAAVWLMAVIYARRKKGVISADPHLLRSAKLYFSKIIQVGFPSSLQYLLTVVAVAALTHFVSRYATEATAALGVVKRLDYLPLYFSIGLSQGILPLLAYNHAANNIQRRNQVFRCGMMLSLGFAIACFVVYELWAEPLALFFTQEPTTVDYITQFLRIQVVAMPFMAICYPAITYFQAMQRTREALVCSILRKGVLDIPLLFLMNGWIGLYGCMWVQPIVDCTSMLFAVYFLWRITGETS